MFDAAVLHAEVKREFTNAGFGLDAEDRAGLAPLGFKDREQSVGEQWLRACGEASFFDNGDLLIRASDEVRAKRNANNAEYQRTPEGRDAHRAANRTWWETKGKIAREAKRAAAKANRA